MSKPIYTVTAAYKQEPLKDFSVRGDRYRTFGFFHELKEARKAVRENRCDLHECLYNFLVIERYTEGIHSFGDIAEFYEWKDEKGDVWDGKWKKLSRRPKCFKNIFNIGLG